MKTYKNSLYYVFLTVILFIVFIITRPMYNIKSISVENQPSITDIYYSFNYDGNQPVPWTCPMSTNWHGKWDTKVLPIIIDKFYIKTNDVVDFSETSLPLLILSNKTDEQIIKGELQDDYIVYSEWNRYFFYEYFDPIWNFLQLLTAILIMWILYLCRGFIHYIRKEYKTIFNQPEYIVLSLITIAYIIIGLLFWNAHSADLFQNMVIEHLTDRHWWNEWNAGSRKFTMLTTAFFWIIARDYGIQIWFQLASLVFFLIVLIKIMQNARIPKIIRCIILFMIAIVPDIIDFTLVPHSNMFIVSVFLTTITSVLGYLAYNINTPYWNSKFIYTALIFGLLSTFARTDGVLLFISIFLLAFYIDIAQWKKTFGIGIIMLILSFGLILSNSNDHGRTRILFMDFAYDAVYKYPEISQEDKAFILSISVKIDKDAWWWTRNAFYPTIDGELWNKEILNIVKKYPLTFIYHRITRIFDPNMFYIMVSLTSDFGIQRNNVPTNSHRNIIKTEISKWLNYQFFHHFRPTMMFIRENPFTTIFILIFIIVFLSIKFPITSLLLSGVFIRLLFSLFIVPTIVRFYFADVFYWLLILPILLIWEHYIRKQKLQILKSK